MKWFAIIIMTIVTLLMCCVFFQQYQIDKLKKTDEAVVRAIGVSTELIEILMFKTRYQR